MPLINDICNSQEFDDDGIENKDVHIWVVGSFYRVEIRIREPRRFIQLGELQRRKFNQIANLNDLSICEYIDGGGFLSDNMDNGLR